MGTTSAVEGGIALDAQGRILADGSRFTVDLRQLKSDEARRDSYVRRNTLETDRTPSALFVPAEVRGLSSPPPEAGPATFEIVGDLTIHDVTRRVTWQATATFDGPEVTVKATARIHFEDFRLSVPRLFFIVSVEDTVRIEADLTLRRV